MITAPVNKILPTSLVDGPGNRVSIFLQGCNIRCAYCHNPETQRMCIHCGICVPGCPTGALEKRDGRVEWDPSKCIDCDQCIKVCPHFASPKIREMTPEQVHQKVMESVPFIRGITVSGGECTQHPQFLLELFRLVKAEGLTCLIDSNGMVDLMDYPELVEVSDGVMLDVKSWDNEVYTALTGFGNLTVKKNLAYLASLNKLEEIRVVCLPGEVDAEAAIAGIAETIGPELLCTVPLRIITFRPYGVRGRLEQTPPPSTDYMQGLVQYARSLGFEQVLLV